MSQNLILFTKPVAAELLQRIRAISPGCQVRQVRSETGRDVPDDYWLETEILYTHGVVPELARAPKLKWVHLHGAGTDKVRGTDLWQSDVLITNGSGIHAPAMGEYVLMMMLVFAHRLPLMRSFQRRREWGGPTLRTVAHPHELRRETVGIIGYGSLGQEIGRLAHGVGMYVIGVNRTGAFDQEGYVVPELAGLPGKKPDELYSSKQLHEVLPRCDYVVLTVPATAETHHLIDAPELRMMKDDAVLVNVSRGTVVNEKTLIEALQDDLIKGAALDVFEEEPLPQDSPLWAMDNVLISPHLSGWTPRYDERSVELFITNVRRYLAGETLLNQVYRQRGY